MNDCKRISEGSSLSEQWLAFSGRSGGCASGQSAASTCKYITEPWQVSNNASLLEYVGRRSEWVCDMRGRETGSRWARATERPEKWKRVAMSLLLKYEVSVPDSKQKSESSNSFGSCSIYFYFVSDSVITFHVEIISGKEPVLTSCAS